MRNDERSGAGEAAAPAARGFERYARIWSQPGLLAGTTALIGLAVGFILGRATVSVPEDGAVRVERSLVADPGDRAAKVSDPEVAPEPLDSYRARFNRLPKGSSGFARDDAADRATAVIGAEGGHLHVEIAPKASDYALTAILRVKDGNAGNLKPSLDGRALGTWALSGEWAAYTAPIARDQLSEGPHELSLAPSDLPASASVGVDSVAVAPVEKELAITMGAGAVGNLVDGFSKFEGRTVWSIGPRSTIVAVLAPQPGPYQLRVGGYALPTLAPLQVTVKVNGTDVGSKEFQPKAREARWSVPAGVLRAGLNQIELSYAKTARPVDYNPKSKDKRELALRYGKVALLPQP